VDSLANLLAINLKAVRDEMEKMRGISDELTKALAAVAIPIRTVQNLFPSQAQINKMLESVGLESQSRAATIKHLMEMANSFNLSALQSMDWKRLNYPISDNYFLGAGWQRRASDPIPAKKSPIGFGHPNRESAD